MNRLFVFIAIVLLSFFTVGCDTNDADDKPLTTVEEDKANIQASLDRIKNVFENFKNGAFYKFAYQFTNAKDNAIYEFVEMLGKKFEDVVDFDKITEDNRFNFAALAGKYVWNSNSNSWNKSANDFFLALFPSSANIESNDCETTITTYSDKLCAIEGNSVYLPASAIIYFKKDNEQLFSTHFLASYSDYGIPEQLTANIYARPLTFIVSFTQENASKLKLDVNIIDEMELKNDLTISCEASLANGVTHYSFFENTELNELKFSIIQHEISIVGTVDVKTLGNLNQTGENINKYATFEVFHKTQKTGTLTAVDLDGNLYFYIVYKDGTKENISLYFYTLIEDIKKIFTK
jgi:hypothetical protein